jgi:predicted nucleic acid-binding protein
LDASAAAEIAKQSRLGALFINKLLTAEEVLAPDLYISEITNVMWKLWRLDRKNKTLFRCMATDCIDYADSIVSSCDLWQEALIEAQNMDHPVYDMLYVALAKRTDATLLTGDGKLAAVARAMGVQVYDGQLPEA